MTATALNLVLVPALCLVLGPTAALAVEPVDDLAGASTVPTPSPSAS